MFLRNIRPVHTTPLTVDVVLLSSLAFLSVAVKTRSYLLLMIVSETRTSSLAEAGTVID
jgi:hypothetical protein